MATYYLAVTGNDTTGDGSSGNPWRKLSKAGAAVAPGDTVFVKGSAGNAAGYPTTSLDYTETTYFTPVAGSQSAGWVKWLPDPSGPTPTIGSPGMLIYNSAWQWFEALYIVCTGNATGTYGLINAGSGPLRFKGNTVHLNNQASQLGIAAVAGGAVIGNEIYGGTTSPSASTADGIILGGGALAVANRVRYCRGDGITDTFQGGAVNGCRVIGNRVWRCAGNGVTIASVSASIPTTVAGNTIDQNGGHGVAVTGTAGIANTSIFNNLITNHTGTGKAGLSVSDGTLATNDARKLFCNYNAFYNNSSHYGSPATITAGGQDVDLGATAPGYTDAANGDFTPTATALQAAL